MVFSILRTLKFHHNCSRSVRPWYVRFLSFANAFAFACAIRKEDYRLFFYIFLLQSDSKVQWMGDKSRRKIAIVPTTKTRNLCYQQSNKLQFFFFALLHSSIIWWSCVAVGKIARSRFHAHVQCAAKSFVNMFCSQASKQNSDQNGG